jgi:hypothetical protein
VGGVEIYSFEGQLIIHTALFFSQAANARNTTNIDTL